MARILIVNDASKNGKHKNSKCKTEKQSDIGKALNSGTLKTFKNEKYDIVLVNAAIPELDNLIDIIDPENRKNPVIIVYNRINGVKSKNEKDGKSKDGNSKNKTVSSDEFVERISNYIDQITPQKKYYKFGGLEIDSVGRTVFADGIRINMTPKVSSLLFYFVENVNVALSREKLLNDVWGFDFFGDERTVDTHIKMLRKCLGKYKKFIVTVRGIGYKFEVL